MVPMVRMNIRLHLKLTSVDDPWQSKRNNVAIGAPRRDELMMAYHDEEWGVPVHDDRKQFEFLTLESAQAGLSWSTVLRKRELPQGVCRIRS